MVPVCTGAGFYPTGSICYIKTLRMASLTVRTVKDEILQIITDFRHGETSADECFCLVLSLEGYESTRFSFLSQIDSLKLTHPGKHSELYNVYANYFSQCPTNEFTDPIECSVENGLLSSDFGYELDMEVAMSRSLMNTLLLDPQVEHGQSHRDRDSLQSTSYASFFSKSNSSKRYSAQSSHDKVHSKISETSVCLNPSVRTVSETGSDMTPLPQTANRSNIPGLAAVGDKLGNGKRKKKGKKTVLTTSSGIPVSLSNEPVIYWLRRDLRIHDNPALAAAAELCAPVIMVFLWSEKEEDPQNDIAAGGATKLWLHNALRELDASLIEKYGNGIIFRKTSDSKTEIKRIFAETGASTLVMNEVYEPFLKARDDKICNNLEMKGITCKRFHSYLLYEPGSVSTDSIGMRGVGSVGHFMECCRRSSTQPIGQPLDAPGLVSKPSNIPSSMLLEELELARMPRRKDGTVVRQVVILNCIVRLHEHCNLY